MIDRVNRLVGRFVRTFGLSPDVIYYKEGRPAAFRMFDRNGKFITYEAEELENGQIICRAIVKQL
jgi:hypothetical protein